MLCSLYLKFSLFSWWHAELACAGWVFGVWVVWLIACLCGFWCFGELGCVL